MFYMVVVVVVELLAPPAHQGLSPLRVAPPEGLRTRDCQRRVIRVQNASAAESVGSIVFKAYSDQ